MKYCSYNEPLVTVLRYVFFTQLNIPNSWFDNTQPECRHDDVTAELKQLIMNQSCLRACSEHKTLGKYWLEQNVTVFFMMLHVARLWRAIVKITSPLAKEDINKAGNYPHFKLDQSNLKRHSENIINCKKKKKYSYDKKVIWKHVFFFTDYWMKNNVHIVCGMTE